MRYLNEAYFLQAAAIYTSAIAGNLGQSWEQFSHSEDVLAGGRKTLGMSVMVGGISERFIFKELVVFVEGHILHSCCSQVFCCITSKDNTCQPL